ncbi:uncharacterized protein LOC143855937 [Tasmannia lanceolata]|uniref:uncharacterized protein LOC143855937 n=1 Tax=Tasmannia lanceolata TaxID=3420 RepID=UPI0040629BE4
MFSSIVDVLDIVAKSNVRSDQRGEAGILLDSLQSFDFIFNIYLMKNILGITNELSQDLQKRDQEIVNAMILVKIAMRRLEAMRTDEAFDTLLKEVFIFCDKQNIVVPNMDDMFVPRGRSRRNIEEKKNIHHYRIELFYPVIDKQLNELNDRLTVANTELLSCMACLNPSDSFSGFDKHKLVRLAAFYPVEFSPIQLLLLDNQLETYIIDMKDNI